jgi:hypothetical protein
MMYGYSPFTYGASTPAPKPMYSVGNRVKSAGGEVVIKDRRLNGNGWEYGVEMPGLTKGALIWYREASL